MNIGIIYTTFLRDELMYRTIQSILDNWNKDYMLFVGNQSFKDSDNTDGFRELHDNIKNPHYHPIEYFNLPYDCGLSFARNFLVKRAYEQGFKYCLITADSIEFTSNYNFEPIIEFLEQNNKRAIVGFDLRGRVYWTCDMKLIPDKHFLLDMPQREPILYRDIKFQSCNVTKNFFLAKTEALVNIGWDNNLKLSEHEDFAYRVKQADYEWFYTNIVSANYIDNKPLEYMQLRQRMSNEFREILKKKYNISGWVQYTDALRKQFDKWRKPND